MGSQIAAPVSSPGVGFDYNNCFDLLGSEQFIVG
jgi:hypothetical protein